MKDDGYDDLPRLMTPAQKRRSKAKIIRAMIEEEEDMERFLEARRQEREQQKKGNT